MKKPIRHPAFVLEQNDQQTYLINTTTGDEVDCSKTVVLVWQLCDGTTDVEEMVTLLRAAYPDSSDEILHDVYRVIAQLAKLGAVTDRSE